MIAGGGRSAAKSCVMTSQTPRFRARPGQAQAGRPGGASRPVRRKLSREEQKTLRAQELLEAAWAMFCESGYEAVSIEAVAERAGYSRQPVYTLFGDKQNLFFELQSRATVEVVDLLFASLRPGASLREILVQVAGVVAEQLNSGKPTHGEQLFFVAQTIALSRPDIAAKLHEQARWVIEEMARIVGRSRLSEGEELRNPPEVIASQLAAYIHGLTTVQFLTGHRGTSAEDLAKIFFFLTFRSG
jgi:AcrR family transcriptional regulator